MSQRNDFKAFSISENANIVSQEKYEESQNLKMGFPPENVSTHILNKVLRQSSTISSVVANFIATQSGEDVLDDGDIAKLTELFNSALDKALEQKASNISGTPVGSPIPWPLPHPPSGYFTCNGSVFSRSQYPKLAEAYPDGRLPDLRGEFIRGWDDGRGVDSGRGILTHQGDAIRNITGSVSGRTVSTSSRMFSYAGGAFYTSVTNPGSHFNAGATYNSVAQDRFSLLEIDASRIVPTANENRPRNIAFNYIVKAE
ncbi:MULTISPECIES: phage tail protein [unclassified Photorhabdus]|uniref:phage tail protein n=1 Tax=unclassified Photorhabdus TaxID=2620880 RepID=UPI000DCEF73C|nr:MULTISPECIES: phage tail protein [unclassified Photorhabdus]RAX00792.1 phage tail protein [Photorhabdus sp. S9-53]RAX00995.1 phage tail protein [Photorhabdus sp. S10-54]RAX05334.1 phage tail protein [Photorhabdus sp. S8-52]